MRQRDEHGRDAEQHERPAPADAGDEPRAEQRHDHRPDVAARDVGTDGEAAALRGELFGQQPVADRMLGRAADAGDDQRAANAAMPGASAIRAWKPPITTPPNPSSRARVKWRVSEA